MKISRIEVYQTPIYYLSLYRLLLMQLVSKLKFPFIICLSTMYCLNGNIVSVLCSVYTHQIQHV